MSLKSLMVQVSALTFGVALTALPAPSFADEGMWTFDNFPRDKVRAAYGVDITKDWLNQVQKASVRLSNCSASVISPDGLVLTNHHCVVACVQDVSTPETNYVDNGFLKARREEERTCPTQVAEILMSITDVTADVTAAGNGLSGEAFVRAQNARISELEKSGCQTPDLRCQVVSLYQGGQYKLYTYRRYDDVRLVFAPEAAIAAFGGDPDNFNFPRYSLDFGLLRIYENGKPISTPDYLRLTTQTPAEGELVLVSGNPGTTQRLLTADQLETQRDLIIPVQQLMRSELRGRVIQFSTVNDEHRRNADSTLQSLENSFKVFYGQQLALQQPDLIAAKRDEENALRPLLERAEFKDMADPWAQIRTAQNAQRDLYLPTYFLNDALNGSTLFFYARNIVRGASEREKQSAERLPEYSDARLPALERRVLSTAPVYRPLEEMILGFRLSKAREYLTADAPTTRLLLGNESPEGLAARLIGGTRLDDLAYRKQLWEGGMEAVLASDDPLIRYALAIEQESIANRKLYEERVTGPIRVASQNIARLRFAAYGTQVYPDATFTLRLSYGGVKGWTYAGTDIAPYTRLEGLYQRATGNDPYALPESWTTTRGQQDMGVVFNYVTTNDIIGGNSGSPVLNAKGEVVGAAFDGNIHSLGGSFHYDGTVNRTVVVSSAIIAHALDKVYGRHDLLSEMGLK